VRFCQPHWDAIRAALDERGMTDLIASSGARAVVNTARDYEAGHTTLATFDPLMGAHWAIVNRVMEVVGLSILSPNEDGTDRCPICYAREHHASTECPGPPDCLVDDEWFEAWIPSVADHMVAEWERLKAGEQP
jgi:hypothetical protein